MKEQYQIRITQETNYVCVEGLYLGTGLCKDLTDYRYSTAIDAAVIGLLGNAFNIECLSRKTVADVRSHEYRIDAKVFTTVKAGAK